MSRNAAVLYLEDRPLIILRDVERALVNEIKSQYGKEQCICKIGDKEVDFGKVVHVVWMDHADIGD